MYITAEKICMKNSIDDWRSPRLKKNNLNEPSSIRKKNHCYHKKISLMLKKRLKASIQFCTRIKIKDFNYEKHIQTQ